MAMDTGMMEARSAHRAERSEPDSDSRWNQPRFPHRVRRSRSRSVHSVEEPESDSYLGWRKRRSKCKHDGSKSALGSSWKHCHHHGRIGMNMGMDIDGNVTAATSAGTDIAIAGSSSKRTWPRFRVALKNGVFKVLAKPKSVAQTDSPYLYI